MTDKYVRKNSDSKKSISDISTKASESKPFKFNMPKGPCFNVSKGIVTNVSIKYKMGPESQNILKKYFGDKLPKKDSDKERLIFKDVEWHPHGLGAFNRAYLSDLVYYKYEPKSEIFEPSVSKIRLASRFDFDGTSLSHRVHSSCCIIDDRDIIRDMNNWRRLEDMNLFNNCSCKLVNAITKCPTNNCDREFPVVLGVENVYYPNVLEGMCLRILANKGTGYFVFNDYQASQLVSGNKGKCADGESSYKIEGSVVTSTVSGNPMPYIHGIVNTGGQSSWQYKIKLNVDGKLVECFVLCEVLEAIPNGDVPAKLVRFNVIQKEWMFNKEGFKGVMCFDSIFAADEVAEEKTDAKLPAIQTVKIPEEPTKVKASLDLKFAEIEHRKTVKEGDKVVDFTDRTMVEYHGWEFLDFVISQFKSSTERLFLTTVKDKQYVNLELVEKPWYGLGLKLTTQLFTAEVKTVQLAYTKLGVKALTSSIDQAVSAAQRELEKELDVSGTMDLTEAFAIARVIRAQQSQRLIKCLAASSSVRFVKENK